jgi:hypothetical protein
MEYDPITRPFVHTAGAQVASVAALWGADHGRLPIAMNGLGVALSIKQRVADR